MSCYFDPFVGEVISINPDELGTLVEVYLQFEDLEAMPEAALLAEPAHMHLVRRAASDARRRSAPLTRNVVVQAPLPAQPVDNGVPIFR